MKSILDLLGQLNPIFQLLTLIALIAYVWKTWTMASATSKAACASEESIREMRLSREEYGKPKVVCYFEHNEIRRNIFDFVIKNFGNSTAFDVRMVFSPPIRQYGPGVLNQKTFKIMPPGYEWRTCFNQLPGTNHSSVPDEFNARISYEWDTPRKHEDYVVDFDIRSVMGSMYLRESTMEDRLQQIAEVINSSTHDDSLHEIARSVNVIAKALEKHARARRFSAH